MLVAFTTDTNTLPSARNNKELWSMDAVAELKLPYAISFAH
jgi:hypothetical protein